MFPTRLDSSATVLPSLDTPAHRLGWRRFALCLCVSLAGIAISALVSWLLSAREEKLAEVQFKLDAGKRIESLQRATVDRLGIVSTVAAFFAGSRLVEREEFHTFTLPIMEGRPGTVALMWAPRIPAKHRETHQQAVRREGLSTYAICQHDDRGRLVAAGKRDEYYPILYAQPSEEGQSLLGFDLGSDPACGMAIRQALVSRRQAAVITTPLDGKPTDPCVLCVVEPAWNEDTLPEKRPADQPEIDGFAVGVFRICTVVETSLSLFTPVGIDIYLTGPADASGKTPVYVHPSRLRAQGGAMEPAGAPTPPATGGVHLSGSIDVANLCGTVDCVPTEVYLAGHRTWEPTVALLAGLAVTGLLVGYLSLLAGRKARVEQQVAERTRELGESEERFRRLIDNAGDAFFLRDEQGKILDVNKRACDSLGYTREELLSMTIADLDVQFVSRNLQQYAKLPAEEYPVTFEGRERRKDGTTFPVEVRMAVLEVGGRRLMLSLVRDITDRKRAEEALRQEQRLLRDMLDLHERDRKLVAYEIHDGLAQQLTGALYKFQSVDRLRESDLEAAKKTCDEGVGLLREAMAEARRLIGGLRPPVLDEAGVVPAVEYLVAEHQRHDGPEIEFVHEVQFDRLAPPLESALFRIVQECLTNACRYSQSLKVRVELRQAGDRVRIEVQDWGVGFDLTHIGDGHFGLRGIRERARLLGGTVNIQTAPQQGTHVTVEFPLIPLADNGTAEGGDEIANEHGFARGDSCSR